MVKKLLFLLLLAAPAYGDQPYAELNQWELIPNSCYQTVQGEVCGFINQYGDIDWFIVPTKE